MKRLRIIAATLAIMALGAYADPDPTFTDSTGAYACTNIVLDGNDEVESFTANGVDYGNRTTLAGGGVRFCDDTGIEWVEIYGIGGGIWGDNGGATTFILNPRGVDFGPM